jgi:hypothetical protein
MATKRKNRSNAYTLPHLTPPEYQLLLRIMDIWRTGGYAEISDAVVLGNAESPLFRGLPQPISVGVVWYPGEGRTIQKDATQYGGRILRKLVDRVLVYVARVERRNDLGARLATATNLYMILPTPAGVRFMLPRMGIEVTSGLGQKLIGRAVEEFTEFQNRYNRKRRSIRVRDISIKECSPEYYTILNTVMNFPSVTVLRTPAQVRAFEALDKAGLVFCSAGSSAGCYRHLQGGNEFIIGVLPTPQGVEAAKQIAKAKHMTLRIPTVREVEERYRKDISNVSPRLAELVSFKRGLLEPKPRKRRASSGTSTRPARRGARSASSYSEVRQLSNGRYYGVRKSGGGNFVSKEVFEAFMRR